MNNIVAFYHITLINDWQNIFQQTLNDIIESELYEVVDKIYMGVIDTPGIPQYLDDQPYRWIYDVNSYEKLLEMLKPYEKFEILYRETKSNKDERLTFNIIYDKCIEWKAQNIKKKILYFHSKGVTHTNTLPMTGWRDTMNEFLIRKWKVALEKLEEYDTVTCLQIDTTEHEYFDGYGNKLTYELHSTGGYWWTNSNYVTTVMYDDSMRYQENRIGFEGLICSASPKEKHFSFFNVPGKLPEQGQVFLPTRDIWKAIRECEYI